MSNRVSPVWAYFEQCSEDAEKATCKRCAVKIQCKGSSTSGLSRHLLKHGVTLGKRIAEDDLPVPKPTKEQKTSATIFKYVRRKSLAEIVSRLAALDGLTIHQITRSGFIRESIASRGYSLPKHEKHVMRLITDYHAFIKEQVIQKIGNLKKQNLKVSLTLDEWTSTKNRRYLNINVHYSNGDFDNLGLVRIEGSCTSEKTLELVGKRSSEFGIDMMCDVVCQSMDGASVMVKYGTLCDDETQLCYNHGIHLAVTKDVLYSEALKSQQPSQPNLSEGEEESADEADDSEEVWSDDDFSSDNDAGEDELFDLRPDFAPAIKQTRQIVMLFTRSPVRDEILQKHVKNQIEKELELKKDCHQRWNSIEPMLDKFLLLQPSIEKALADLKLLRYWRGINLALLRDILDALKSIKLAVEALSARDANLLTSEGVFRFLFQALESQQSRTSLELLVALRSRLQHRRNRVLVSFIRYLQDPACLDEKELDEFFEMSSKSEMTKFAKKLLVRLFPSNGDAAVLESEEQQELLLCTTGDCDLKDQLQQSIQRCLTAAKPLNENYKTLIKEFNIYEATGQRTKNLQLLFEALKTVRPTSTECERVFSVAGNFVTKRRSRLSDKAVDALCFLKSHFLKDQDKK